MKEKEFIEYISTPVLKATMNSHHLASVIIAESLIRTGYGELFDPRYNNIFRYAVGFTGNNKVSIQNIFRPAGQRKWMMISYSSIEECVYERNILIDHYYVDKDMEAYVGNWESQCDELYNMGYLNDIEKSEMMFAIDALSLDSFDLVREAMEIIEFGL